MKLDVTALGMTGGVFWGGAVLVVAAANLVWPPYGMAFLELAASIYPGYHAGCGIGSVVAGTLYAVVDGAGAGALFGLLYNFLAPRTSDGAG
ncbi:MAG: hypothetical protein MUO39_13560 [Steroidobacteraceae bacterium]|nr:hypothetical protein [Steroidobacteraceae bacterium]